MDKRGWGQDGEGKKIPEENSLAVSLTSALYTTCAHTSPTAATPTPLSLLMNHDAGYIFDPPKCHHHSNSSARSTGHWVGERRSEALSLQVGRGSHA